MSKDFKETLLMPKTEFAMRGNLGVKEKDIQEEWNKIDLYSKRLEKNKGNKPFILHDGPPYANGNIHMGHAFNKSLKDFVVRYKSMSGFYSPYIPGWDTHGLPIENAVTKSGVKRKELNTVEFRKHCYEYAIKQVNNQKEQFKRLGVLGDWDNPYLTLDPKFEEQQIKVFAKMVEKELIFKGLKPVYWSPSSESALAEAEIIYKEKTSPSIYVAFPEVNNKFEFVIWTTTPWTMPANLAIAVGENLDYTHFKANDRNFIVASELLESIVKTLEFDKYEIVKKYKGKDLEGMKYKHPLYDRVSPVVIGHHVTLDGGTGLVHTAPGHGEDDFIIGKKYKLDILCPVNSKGVLTNESVHYEGLFFDDANKVISKDLEEKGALLKISFIKHSYPHDWRTEKPIIFRATEQWFASIEKLKKQMLSEIGKIEWLPKWGETRLSNMIKDREEWCISRQRVWGVPIPAFYAENGDIILTPETVNHVSKLIGQHGSSIWFEKDAKDLLPKGFTHKGSPNGTFTKETDIMDVWFDSGTTHQGVLVERGLDYPADLYLEGSDQYRGWFNSSLSTSIAVSNKSPYKTCLTHGFVNDEKGLKMSKSKGNGIDPIKESNKMGADILRLWVASVDYSADVRLGQNLLKQVSESYRKIRNSSRFILGNINDFNKENIVPYKDLNEVDKYMQLLLNKFTNKVIKYYDSYQFNEIFKLINNFITNELSAFYLDFTKDILYIEKANSKNRRSVQTVYNNIISTMMKLLTPILPHTTHEVYSFLNIKNEENIYLEEMPKEYKFTKEDEALIEKYDVLMKVRNDVLKALEIARDNNLIGKSFSAHIKLELNDDITLDLNTLKCNIAQLFIVSKLDITKTKNAYDGQVSKVEVYKAEGHVCARCWQVVDTVNTDEICSRCESVIK